MTDFLDAFMDYVMTGVIVLLLAPLAILLVPVFAPLALIGWIAEKIGFQP